MTAVNRAGFVIALGLLIVGGASSAWAAPFFDINFDISSKEPASIALLGAGLFALGCGIRRRLTGNKSQV